MPVGFFRLQALGLANGQGNSVVCAADPALFVAQAFPAVLFGLDPHGRNGRRAMKLLWFFQFLEHVDGVGVFGVKLQGLLVILDGQIFLAGFHVGLAETIVRV